MPNPRAISVLLLFCCASAYAAAPKVHSVSLGAVKRVPFVAADVSSEDIKDEASSLRVRPLIVDGRTKEWTTGDLHDVTERTFAVRRVLHVNDTLPGEKTTRWVWQPGSWLLIDRITGHITPLHLPNYDATVSDVVWYRDYAAYCGIHTTAKASNLTAEVWQAGARRAALERPLAKWTPDAHPRPVCAPAVWQRAPIRVTLQPTGGTAQSFDISGTSAALIEEADNDDDQ